METFLTESKIAGQASKCDPHREKDLGAILALYIWKPHSLRAVVYLQHPLNCSLNLRWKREPLLNKRSHSIVAVNESKQEILHFTLNFTSDLEYKGNGTVGTPLKEQNSTCLSIS